jgi:hypothetical protein
VQLAHAGMPVLGSQLPLTLLLRYRITCLPCSSTERRAAPAVTGARWRGARRIGAGAAPWVSTRWRSSDAPTARCGARALAALVLLTDWRRVESIDDAGGVVGARRMDRHAPRGSVLLSTFARFFFGGAARDRDFCAKVGEKLDPSSK